MLRNTKLQTRDSIRKISHYLCDVSVIVIESKLQCIVLFQILMNANQLPVVLHLTIAVPTRLVLTDALAVTGLFMAQTRSRVFRSVCNE